MKTLCGALALAFLTLAAANPADAETIVLDNLPIRIDFETRDERVAKKVGEICAADVDRLAQEVGVDEIAPIRIEVTSDISAYRRRLGNDLPTWGVAFALMGHRRMVVDAPRATRAYNSLESVIPHELSHLLVAQRIGRVSMPIWFLEGLAQWQAREWTMIDSWQLMNAVWANSAPGLWNLIDRYPEGEQAARTAYRISYVAFTTLFDQRLVDLPRFLDAVARTGDFERAFDGFFGENTMAFYVRFQEDLTARYHSRLLIFQTGPLLSILAVLFLALGLRYFFHKRRVLKEMDRLERGLPFDDDEDTLV